MAVETQKPPQCKAKKGTPTTPVSASAARLAAAFAGASRLNDEDAKHMNESVLRARIESLDDVLPR